MASRIILITGANRGIGFCIAQVIAQKHTEDTLIITARVHEAALEAVQSLRDKGVSNPIDPVVLDITSDESIHAAVSFVKRKYNRLDVLINNAGIAAVPSSDLSNYRRMFNSVLDTNVTATGLITSLMLPLLLESQDPRVINISSGRASITRLTSGDLPPTVSIPYSVSKVALNALTLEMAKAEPHVKFYVANPGHCKTAFNGYKGAKDPLIGAKVAADLVSGDHESGFWHNDGGKLEQMPW